ncbi:GH92 family glycosyl hydrolase [Dyella sp. 2HG41-7]|uniref:GH92 family glycosyl hydrolase n=1 Tax=Dyella sp. 2HG41-7 TaxID=2883239 RepID=UPI001F39ABF6|nr:GH92 family glycosyl hydrolase [Dyella sp. 2HG41-7]
MLRSDRAHSRSLIADICLILALCAFASTSFGRDAPKTATPVDWVNTFIGTGGEGAEYGGTMPFVTTPFGMTNWTAQTRQNRISVSSYEYDDTYIQGFIGTHQPAIWMGDYGYVTLMPEMGDANYAPEARRLAFTHKDEISTPYYYAVTMGPDAAHKIFAEMTATDHAGYLRFVYPHDAKPSVLIEATRPGIEGFVSIDASRNEIVGYNPDRMDAHLGPFALKNFKGYFVVRFKQPMAAAKVYEGVLTWPDKKEVQGNNVGAIASFDTDTVDVQVGTSFISIDQARANLDAEMLGWNFDDVRDSLKTTWNKKLGIASIEGASDDQRRIFYSGLYHALLYPKLFSEHGRYYSAFDDRVHNGVSYTAYSIWDIFRAENSLLTIFAPERIDGMVQALLQDYVEGGWMPKWPNPSYTNIMIGTHADSLVAEAINKGFKGFDYQLAYKAVYKDAMTPPDGDTTRRWFDREPHTPYEARAGLTYAEKLGYIPADKILESASSTQEESYDDYAVAQVAKALDKTDDYNFFMKRSTNYRNLFNPARGFMQAKNADGTWASPDDGWTEGDQWVYLFAALHDVPGVVKLLGGPDAAAAKLDAHFNGGHNRHDNEPSHHYGYLYDFTGQPWKTQARVREIARDAYSNTTNGVLGNEDCGQMSAWYIFTAMGFYPMNPASGDYVIGSPLFTRVTLNLPNGKRFEMTAPRNSDRNVYIQSATLNGKPLETPVISYAQIEAGGTLNFVMGPKPSTWASHWQPQALP